MRAVKYLRAARNLQLFSKSQFLRDCNFTKKLFVMNS